MIRRLLILGAELGAFIIIVTAGVLLWASHYIDTDDFRQRFAGVAEQLVGRPVSLDGELNIALYPTLSLEVLNLEIDGEPEFGETPLVAFDKLLVSVRLMPLLSKKIEVRSIVVEGMEVNIVRSKEDKINWQSIINFLRKPKTGGSVPSDQIEAVSLSEFEVVNASVTYEDNVEGQTFSLSGVGLRTGEIVPGADIPFTANSTFAWKNGGIQSEFILKGIVKAGDDGIQLRNSSVYATIGGAFLPEGANPAEVTAQLVMDLSNHSIALDGVRLRFLGIQADGNIRSDDLSQNLKAYGQISVHEFKPSDIIGRYFPKAPLKDVDGLRKANLSTEFTIDESGVSLKKVKAVLDDLTVRGSLAMQNYSWPHFSFDLTGGVVNLDRYIPLFRTGTPFIWDDFGLNLFRLFRGKGSIKAEGLQVLDLPIENIHLELAADKNSIKANARAERKGQGAVLLDGDIRIGKQNDTAIPTLGAALAVTMESDKNGFDFMNIKPISVSGKSSIQASINLADMPCPPSEESINILRHISGVVRLDLLNGKGGYSDKEDSYAMAYSKVGCGLKFSPFATSGNEVYGYNVDSNLRVSSTDKIKSVSFSAIGPFLWDLENTQFKSSGMAVKNVLGGALYTDEQSRFSAHGKVAFDTQRGFVDVNSATIRTLETTLKGSVKLTDLNTSFKASGNIEIPNANARRIIYLLSRFSLRTGAPDALKSISLKTKFSANRDGFRLTDIVGALDGMPLKGNLSAKGFDNPQLVGSLTAGFLDIDRFIPDSKERKLQAKRQGKAYKASPVELPHTFLRWLNVNVKVWLEGLKLMDIRARTVSGNISAHEGAINVSNIKGIVHGGPLKAGWVGEVGEKSLTTHLKLLVENMQAGALLKDMAGKEYVKGVADVDIDVTSFGRTDDNIVENLEGKVRCRVLDGSFKFTGYDVQAKTSDQDGGHELVTTSDPRTRRTVFKKAFAYFDVKKGVFNVDEFRVEAPPLLQSHGKGNFSLPDNTINLHIRNDFVAIPSVSMDITGKLSDPEVNIPKAAIVSDTVRNILSLPEKSFKFLRDLF